MNISEKEAMQYSGGAKLTLGAAAILTAIGSLLMGIIDGFLNPKPCNR